jgi:glycosyltransferase involved in cell wall biosynthesis
MIGISAIVATLNRREELERLFKSILQGNSVMIEVIIIDQNKNDLLVELVSRYTSLLDIKHLRLNEANQSKARNYGASLAKYPIICFPDDDCWFENNSLGQVHQLFAEKSETEMLVIHWNQNPVQGIASGRLTKKMIYSFKGVGYATYVLFFKNEVFRQLGGFIETIGIGKYIGGGEDSELTFRAAERNLNIFYDENIHVNHKYIPIYQRDLPVIRARQRAMGLMYYRYNVGLTVMLKGLASPFIKMFGSLGSAAGKKHFNVFLGRMQGLLHGYTNGKKIFDKTR